jgi:hypothetical protein
MAAHTFLPPEAHAPHRRSLATAVPGDAPKGAEPTETSGYSLNHFYKDATTVLGSASAATMIAGQPELGVPLGAAAAVAEAGAYITEPTPFQTTASKLAEVAIDKSFERFGAPGQMVSAVLEAFVDDSFDQISVAVKRDKAPTSAPALGMTPTPQQSKLTPKP